MNENRTRYLARPAMAMALLLLLGACVTVNIYFPAAEVKKAAANIVQDVYGEDTEKSPGDGSSLEVLLAWLGPTTAHAADVDSVSNATIRNIKQRIGELHGQLTPFYQRGNVGIDNGGLVAIRDTNGLGIQEVAQVKRLVNSDSELRLQLYREVAKALGVQANEVGKVQDIFTREWQGRAPAGYWIQGQDGTWRQK